MVGIRSGNEYGIDLRRAAQVLGRIECQGNIVLPGRRLCLLQGASRKRSNAAGLCQRKSRHQTLHCVQSEAENAKANHGIESVARAASPAAIEVDFLFKLKCLPGTGFFGTRLRGRVARAHTNTDHFPNTRTAGAKLLVTVIVLLGSPPVSWLIWNLVMFVED